jgi:hypothetical protein
MSPLVSKKSTKALLFYLKFILYLTLAWSSLSTWFNHCSGNARLAAND